MLFKLRKVLKTCQITNTDPVDIHNKDGCLIPLHWETKMKSEWITVGNGQIAAWPSEKHLTAGARLKTLYVQLTFGLGKE